MKTLRKLVASTAAIATLFLAPAAIAEQSAPVVAAVPQATGQGPAMWVIRDEDSTVYLFGSFHLLRTSTGWGTRNADLAFASADDVWLELTDMDDLAGAQQSMMEFGVSPDRPLSSFMSAEEIASLDEALSGMGLSAAALDVMRPWLVSLQLVALDMTNKGFDAEAGVEKVFTARAEAMGKPLKGFESMREQFQIMAGISDAGQVAMLNATVRDLAKGSDEVEALVTAWATGDVEALEDAIVDRMKAEQPEVYEALLVRRNANWTNQIREIMAGSGTSFIAVGAGHLVGPDSVQAMLARDGIVATRVPN